MMFDFIEGGAGRELATARNETAFDRIDFQPRVMGDVSVRSLKTTFLGRAYDHPFGIAPMGMCNLTWAGADRMLARAATAFNFPVCLSTAGSSSIEEMRAWAGENAWFQLYINRSVDTALTLVERAEQAGYQTLVLTVDVPQLSRRVRDLRNGFHLPFRMGPRQVLDFALHPRWSLSTVLNGVPTLKNFVSDTGPVQYDRHASRAGADWAFLDRLRKLWPGNLIVKGVMAADDALRIRNAGADAISVSNHGGRQLDGAPAAISVLPTIREALGPDYPLIFDSGLRNGEDVARALALGADFVLLGRPMLYAIGAEGESGLFSLLRIFAHELDLTLAQVGLTRPDQLSPAALLGGTDLTAQMSSQTLRIAASDNRT